MAGVLILNPTHARRKRKARPTRRRRKMTAKQLKFFGPRKRRAKTKAAAAPKVVVVSANPTRRGSMAKRKRSKKASHHKRRRRLFSKNPIGKRRRFRRNPIEGTASQFISSSIMPAAIGAAGAVGTDWVLGNMRLPPWWYGGMRLPLLRIAASIGVGYLVGAMSNEKAGAEAAAGGIVVTFYQMFRPWAQRSFGGRLMRYSPLRGMGSSPRNMSSTATMVRGQNGGRRHRLGLKAAPRRVRRMGMAAYPSPARTSGPMTMSMARYLATNSR